MDILAGSSAARPTVAAVDRATRRVFVHIYRNQTKATSTDFLRRLQNAAPMRISRILTDRFTSKARQPTGKHAFGRACAKLDAEHRLVPPSHPQINGMVERLNGRISEVIGQTRFKSAAELEATLTSCVHTYDHLIAQRALDHCSPVQVMQ